jgi:predicted S18 family serine protease
MDEFLEERPRGGNSRLILVFSVVVNIVLASLAGYALWVNGSQRSQIDGLTDTLNEMTESTNLLEQQLNMSQSQLEYYIELANYYSGLAASDDAASGVIGQSSVPIVAVKAVQRGFTVEYQGVVMEAEVELVEGSGRVLVDTVPMIGIDIQTSVNTAVLVVEELAGVSLSKTDVVLTIRADEEVEVVDGGSAGAAITVALLAAVTEQEINEGVYMTGTIMNDMTLGEIGGVAYKALAVAELGAEQFLIPKGQSTIVVYQPKTVEFFRRSIVTYERVYMDLEEYLAEQGYSIDVVEVETVEEALEYFL